MYTGCLPHPQAGSAGSIANNRLAGPLFPVQTGHHNRECMTLHEQESHPAHVPWHWRGIMHKRGTDASTQRSSLLPWLACAIQRFARQRGSVLELGHPPASTLGMMRIKARAQFQVRGVVDFPQTCCFFMRFILLLRFSQRSLFVYCSILA